MPRWIDKAARRPGERELDVRHAAAALSEHTAARLDAAKVARSPIPPKPWLQPSPHDFPPASRCTIKGELAKFPAKGIFSGHSPLYHQLLVEGLIEVVRDQNPPYSCLGLRLTAKGLKHR
jgi:hypothetical protein